MPPRIQGAGPSPQDCCSTAASSTAEEKKRERERESLCREAHPTSAQGALGALRTALAELSPSGPGPHGAQRGLCYSWRICQDRASLGSATSTISCLHHGLQASSDTCEVSSCCWRWQRYLWEEGGSWEVRGMGEICSLDAGSREG